MKQTVLRDREGNKLPVHGFKNNNSIIFRVGLINNASLILRHDYTVITQMFINLRKVRNQSEMPETIEKKLSFHLSWHNLQTQNLKLHLGTEKNV